MTPTLSSELIVACEIYYYNILKEPIWFSKLVDSLKCHMDKSTVSRALDTLTDWLIIYAKYGETENGRAGCLWFVYTDNGNDIIHDLYEKYWRDARCQ
jgi:predicted transcriptional regulator